LPANKRVSVYVDGFNLYHAIDRLNEPDLKWLDLWSLSEKLVRADETVDCVKYFSAFATWRERSYRKHQRYVDALKSKGVVFIQGRFKEKPESCRDCGVRYVRHEEKETDVNIGAHLLADCLRDRFDRALVISADTDLLSAVALARTECSDKRIDIVAPPGRKGRNAAALFEITKGRLKRSLLPASLNFNGREIVRPAAYDPRDV